MNVYQFLKEFFSLQVIRVEDELHVNCPFYDELRSNFYQSLQVIGINMDEKSPISQFNFI